MSANDCRDCRPLLSALIEGDLDDGKAAEVRRHLECCPGCRAELAQLRLTIDALRRLRDLPPPAAILAGVRERLKPEPWYRRLLEGSRWRFELPLGAAASLLVVFGVSLYLSRHPQLSETLSQAPSPKSFTRVTPQAPPKEALPSSAERQPAAERDRDTGRPPLRAAAPAAPVTPPAPVAPAVPAAPVTPPAPVALAVPAPPVTPAGPAAPMTPPEPVALAVPTPRANSATSVESTAPPAQAAPVASAVGGAPPALDDRLTTGAPGPASPPRDTVRVDATAAGEASLAAAPGRRESVRAAGVERAAEATFAGVASKPDERPPEPAFGRDSTPSRQIAEEVREKRPPEMKKQYRAAAKLEATQDAGAGLGISQSAARKASASRLEVVCLLLPGGTVRELESLLAREAATDVEVVALGQPAIGLALARLRARPPGTPEPSRGWEVTGRLPPGGLARLLDALAARADLRVLEQPAAAADPDAQPQPRELRITVLQ